MSFFMVFMLHPNELSSAAHTTAYMTGWFSLSVLFGLFYYMLYLKHVLSKLIIALGFSNAITMFCNASFLSHKLF